MTPFPKELTISFCLGKSVIQKKTQNQNKATFLLTFIPRYSNFEESNFFNLCDCTFNVWYCIITLHMIVGVKPPPWKMHLSSEKLYKRYSLSHCNKYFCTDHNNTIKSQYRNADDVKCLVRKVRELLEKYPEGVRNKLPLYFDYNT